MGQGFRHGRAGEWGWAEARLLPSHRKQKLCDRGREGAPEVQETSPTAPEPIILCVSQDKILSFLGHLSLSPSQRCRPILYPVLRAQGGRQGKGRQSMFPSFMECSVSGYSIRKQYPTSTLTASKKEVLILFLTGRTQTLHRDKRFAPGLSALTISVRIPCNHSFHDERGSKAPGVAMVLFASPSLLPARPHPGWVYEWMCRHGGFGMVLPNPEGAHTSA